MTRRLTARPHTPTNGRRRRRGRRRLPSLAVLPTLCTLGNLVAGFAALLYAASPGTFGPNEWSGLTTAGALVFLGMLLDAIDGSLARLTRSESDLGGQLDSFADMITFGVAPAFMTLMLVSSYIGADGQAASVTVLGPDADNMLGKVVWGAAAIYVCCAALRLARYNVEVGTGTANDRSVFKGLPSPGAAGGVASLIILHQHLLVARYVGDVPAGFAKATALGIPFVMLLCGLAMVSNTPYVHFTNRFIHGSKSFAYMVRIVVLMGLLLWWFQETLAVMFTTYVLSGPVASGWRWVRARTTAR